MKKLLLLLFLIPNLVMADWFGWFEPSNYEECFDNAYKKAKNNQAVYIAREVMLTGVRKGFTRCC